MINTRMFNRRIGAERPYKGDQSTLLAQLDGPSTNWQSIGGMFWASVETIAGGEGVSGSSVQAKIVYRIRTRWRADIIATCRVLLPDPRGAESGLPTVHSIPNCRRLDIISAIDTDGRREVLEITAQDNTNA